MVDLEDINTTVIKEIHSFCKNLFNKYPIVTGINIHGNNPNNMSISIRTTLVR